MTKSNRAFIRILEQVEMLAGDMELAGGMEQARAWGILYKLLHTVTAPKCRNNHPGWTKESRKLLMKLYKSLEE